MIYVLAYSIGIYINLTIIHFKIKKWIKDM